MVENVSKRINYLNKLFNYDKNNNITEQNINYIYLNSVEWCCNYTPQVLIKDIGPFSWDKMVDELNKIYTNSNLYKTKYEKKTLYINDELDLNEIMLKYIQCRSNIKILTQFSSRELNFKDCYLYAIKKIKLSSHEIACLIYQLFCLTKKFKNYEEITKFIKLLNIKNTKTITIYVYENKKKTNIGHDISQDFISDNFITAIHHGQLYFNNNSLFLLKEMLLERYLDKFFQRSRLLLNTLKKMLFVRKISLLEQSKIMVLGGNVLASYGLRPSRDLDVIVSNIPDELDDSFISKTSDIFFDQNKKLFFMDFFHPKVKWEKFWNEWHKEWANMFGANTILECVYNPKFHYYFCGVKFLVLDAEITRRNIRHRPASITDLLMINRLLHRNININPIPKKTIKLEEETITTPETFIKIVKHWFKKKYNSKITEDEVQKIKFI